MIIASPLLIIGIGSFINTIEAEDKIKTKPASEMDVFLYRGMGASYLCNASKAGIEFPKAVGVASATYVQVLEGKHGGVIAQIGKEKLDRKKLFAGAEFQIVTAAMEFCPDNVPNEVKNKVKKVLKEQQKKSKKRK